MSNKSELVASYRAAASKASGSRFLVEKTEREIESLEERIVELRSEIGDEATKAQRDQLARSRDKLRYLKDEIVEHRNRWRLDEIEAKCALAMLEG